MICSNVSLIIESCRTTADTVLPLHKPLLGVDGSLVNKIPVPKGTFLLPSCRGCNVSKAIWGDDALEWKPERWLSPLPSTVTEARIPGVYSNL